MLDCHQFGLKRIQDLTGIFPGALSALQLFQLKYRMYLHKRISISIKMNLQISKWGNSLAVRIPADYVRQIGVKDGDHLLAQVGADGSLNLRPPAQWSRKAFAQELALDAKTLPMGSSVMDELRKEARY
jgi:antitoxin MazE